MSLQEYEKKRDFQKTPEPAPGPTVGSTSGPAPRFVIQRHHARRLHYDFRLEARGVLISWAIPRGPTLDPATKRMAVHVEDHPLDYFDFEGNIPSGNYGAGSVMVWDLGTYTVMGNGDFDAQYQKGDLKLRLDGTKVQGEFALVRTRQANGKDWLLIKKKDAAVRPGWDPEDFSESVLSGRSQAEIVRNAPPRSTGVALPPVREPRRFPPLAHPRPMPSRILPMLAQTAEPFSHSDWIFELKWDGWRALSYLEDGRLRVLSRRGNSLLGSFPELEALRSAVDARSCILDGEIVCLDAQGLPNFNTLQKRLRSSDARGALGMSRSVPVTYYLFDLLYLDGYDLTSVPLMERKALLAQIVRPDAMLRLSDHVEGQGEMLYQMATQKGMEGVVAKLRDSAYENKRSATWLKIKDVKTLDCIVAGYTTGASRSPFKSLVLALHRDGGLVHIGNVGSGFSDALLHEVFQELSPLSMPTCPLREEPRLEDAVHWVRPERVCSVKFSEWTPDRILRHAVFQRMRFDKDPLECRDGDAPADESSVSAVMSNDLLTPSPAQQTLDVDGIALKFTNLEKLYFPDDGITKRDLINFYYRISPALLPHLAERPLNLKRYPDGINGEFFFQKRGEKFPDWVRAERHEDENGKVSEGVICSNLPTLLFLANLGCIDQNPLQSRVGSLEQPDWMLLDLDPQECSYDKIVEVAQLLRSLFERLGLEGYPKTTGGRGMHIYVPVAPGYTFEQTTMLAQVLARLASTRRPDLITLARATSKREKKRVYIDYPQGGRGRSISAPYVPRPVPGATVATPLSWDEVRAGLHPARFTIRNVVQRVEARGDLFAPVLQGGQRLDAAIARLDDLLE